MQITPGNQIWSRWPQSRGGLTKRGPMLTWVHGPKNLGRIVPQFVPSVIKRMRTQNGINKNLLQGRRHQICCLCPYVARVLLSVWFPWISSIRRTDIMQLVEYVELEFRRMELFINLCNVKTWLVWNRYSPWIAYLAKVLEPAIFTYMGTSLPHCWPCKWSYVIGVIETLKMYRLHVRVDYYQPGEQS